MSENLTPQTEMYPEPKRGTWHGPEFDVPAVVVGSYGYHEDGREYLIEQGGMGIPADEFQEEALPGTVIDLRLLLNLAIKLVRR